jgi:restriction endonuclease Mrr
MSTQPNESVPAYQDLMLPILQVLAEHGELHRRDYSRLAGERMGLSEQAVSTVRTIAIKRIDSDYFEEV